MPNGATRTLELMVQQLTAGGGVASLQGRITLPAGVTSPNELRLSIVKPSAGGVSDGAVLRLVVRASGASGQVYTLSWAGSSQAPIVVGSDANGEITGFSTGNGQVKVR